MFDIKHLSIWIVTYNRRVALNKAVAGFLASTPDHVPINIISNHSNLQLDKDYGKRVKVWMNTLRPDESWGYLARNWNQCLYQGLRDHEWVLCSQDDVEVRPGWVEVLESNPNYDFYTAPFFDMMFLMNRQTFRDVGWFDERFLCVDLQDNDYLRRVYQSLGPRRICIEDAHGWRWHGETITPINKLGLSDFWLHGPDLSGEIFDDRPKGGDKIHWRLNAAYRRQKWGVIDKKNHQELDLEQRIPEIDWYPWFTEYIHNLVDLPYPIDRYVPRAAMANSLPRKLRQVIGWE